MAMARHHIPQGPGLWSPRGWRCKSCQESGSVYNNPGTGPGLPVLPAGLPAAYLFVLAPLRAGSQQVSVWVFKAHFSDEVCRVSKNPEVNKSHSPGSPCGASPRFYTAFWEWLGSLSLCDHTDSGNQSGLILLIIRDFCVSF